jgi:hypothetical protein
MEHAEDWDATDLEMIGDLLYIAGYYVEGGIREFGRWSKALTRRFGKGALPMGRSRKPFVKLSEDQKQAALLEVKRLLENEQELRRQYRQNAPPGYLEIKSPGRPSVEERRLMSLCRVNSLEELELVMSFPLSEEWLARQDPELQQALEDWYDRMQREESGD